VNPRNIWLAWKRTGVKALSRVLHSGGISMHKRCVAHIPVQIGITAFKHNPIFARPAPGAEVVPSGDVVSGVSFGVERLAGEGEEEGGVGRVFGEIAEGVVDAMNQHPAGVVDYVADAAEMVGQCPEDRAGGLEAGDLLVGQNLVRAGAVQVAVAEVGGYHVGGSGLVELNDDVGHGPPGDLTRRGRALLSIIHENATFVSGGVGVGVEDLTDPAVGEVVGTFSRSQWLY